MTTMKQLIITLAFSSLIAVVSPLYAHDDNDSHGDAHHHDNNEKHDHDDDQDSMPDMLLQKKKSIDGYTVILHLMAAKKGMEMGGSHHLMIKVEKEGKAVTDLVMNTKVIHPNGDAESKSAMKMDDWYMSGYDLGHDGQHQLMFLFKTADGEKHKGGIYYPAN